MQFSSKDTSSDESNNPVGLASLLFGLTVAGCVSPQFQEDDALPLDEGAIVRTLDPEVLGPPFSVLAPEILRPITDPDRLRELLSELSYPGIENVRQIKADLKGLAEVTIELDANGEISATADVNDHGEYSLSGIYRFQAIKNTDGSTGTALQIKLGKDLLASSEITIIEMCSGDGLNSDIQVSCKFEPFLLARVFGVQALDTKGYIPVERETGNPAELSDVDSEYITKIAEHNPELSELPSKLSGLFEKVSRISTSLTFRNPNYTVSQDGTPQGLTTELFDTRRDQKIYVDMTWGSLDRTVEILGMLGGRVYFRNHQRDSRYYQADSPGRVENASRGIESVDYSTFQTLKPRNIRVENGPELYIGEDAERGVYLHKAPELVGEMERAALEEMHKGLSQLEAFVGLEQGAIEIFYGNHLEKKPWKGLTDASKNANSMVVDLSSYELLQHRDLASLGIMRGTQVFDRSYDVLCDHLVGLKVEKKEALNEVLRGFGWVVSKSSSADWSKSASAGVLFTLMSGRIDPLATASLDGLRVYKSALNSAKIEYRIGSLYKQDNPIVHQIDEYYQETLRRIIDKTADQHELGKTKTESQLSPEQVAQLQNVFGDSIDYTCVHLMRGPDWAFKMNGNRAFVVGNTVHLPKNVAFLGDLLVHEMTHVWQFQNGGSGYIGSALAAQMKSRKAHGHDGEAYRYAHAVLSGKAWEELNPEQQAEIAVAASRLLKNPLQAALAHPDGRQHFTARYDSNGEEAVTYKYFLDRGYEDISDYVLGAIEKIHAREGAKHSKTE